MDSNRKRFRGFWNATIVRESGEVETFEWENLVTNEGLNQLLDRGMRSAQSWYIGLTKEGATPAAADTMASHAGWSENTQYSAASRLLWVPNAVSVKSTTNAASIATFWISASTTFAGAFLTTGTEKNGSTGTLYAVGNFSVARSLASNDSLGITAKFTAADDGA